MRAFERFELIDGEGCGHVSMVHEHTFVYKQKSPTFAGAIAPPAASLDDEDGFLADFGMPEHGAVHEIPAGRDLHDLGDGGMGGTDNRDELRDTVDDEAIGSAPGADLEADHAVRKLDVRRLP